MGKARRPDRGTVPPGGPQRIYDQGRAPRHATNAKVAAPGYLAYGEQCPLDPRNNLLHRRQERTALGRPTVALVLLVVIDDHGQAPLLHVRVNADVPAGNLISIALTLY